MENPWKKIRLQIYENHMRQDSVQQLQCLNRIMKEQFCQYHANYIMILGVAGGNGLEHIVAQKVEQIYGVDINYEYLQECKKKFPLERLCLLCTDLTDMDITLPKADLLIADLLIEYIGIDCFQSIVHQVEPTYISCVIQFNGAQSFVSDSPYVHELNDLKHISKTIEEEDLVTTMDSFRYKMIMKKEYQMPNGKCLVRIDFEHID